jgi:hypothetical protein
MGRLPVFAIPGLLIQQVIDEAGKAQTFLFFHGAFLAGEVQTCRAITAIPTSIETFYLFER